MQQEVKGGNCPTTTRIQEINGKKYIVVSHYAGTKNFKKVLCDSAFRQACAEMKNLHKISEQFENSMYLWYNHSTLN